MVRLVVDKCGVVGGVVVVVCGGWGWVYGVAAWRMHHPIDITTCYWYDWFINQAVRRQLCTPTMHVAAVQK